MLKEQENIKMSFLKRLLNKWIIQTDDLYEVHTERFIDIERNFPYCIKVKLTIKDEKFLVFLNSKKEGNPSHAFIHVSRSSDYPEIIISVYNSIDPESDISVASIIDSEQTFYFQSKSEQEGLESGFKYAIRRFYLEDIKRYREATKDLQIIFTPSTKLQIDSHTKNSIHFSLSVPHLAKEENGKYTQFLKSEKKYNFIAEQTIYDKFKNEIFPILDKFGDFSLIQVFHDDIHYCLEYFAEILKLKANLDINEELNEIVIFLREVETYFDEINGAAIEIVNEFQEQKLTNIIENHHLNMDKLITKAKLFTFNKDK